MNRNQVLAVDVEALPTVSEFALRPWSESYGGDFYGALDVAAEYCGFRGVPPVFPGVWQHGLMPPWEQFEPQIVVFGAPRSFSCFVAREDEVRLLHAAGYFRVRAVGLPILYTKPSGATRVPGSLLVMPTHSLPCDVDAPPCDEYVSQIVSLKGKFSQITACVSANCITAGLWAPQFNAAGIQVVRGAGFSDANSLRRMRALFETFEFVTTDGFSSHVVYALYFGAKVSIWGKETPLTRANFLADATWAAFPDAVDKLFSPETRRIAEDNVGRFRVEPRLGIEAVDFGKQMIGHDNKLSPSDLQACFGWTPLRVLTGSVLQRVCRSRLWQKGGDISRWLRAVVKT